MNLVKTWSGGGGLRPKLRRCHCVPSSGVHRHPRKHPFFSGRSGVGDGGCWLAAIGRGVPFHYAGFHCGRNGCRSRPLGGRRFFSSRNRGHSGKFGFLQASVEAYRLHACRRTLLPVLPVLLEHGCRNRVRVRLARRSSVRLVRWAWLAGRWICDGRRCASRGVAGQPSTVLPPSVPSPGCGGGFVEGEKS